MPRQKKDAEVPTSGGSKKPAAKRRGTKTSLAARTRRSPRDLMATDLARRLATAAAIVNKPKPIRRRPSKAAATAPLSRDEFFTPPTSFEAPTPVAAARQPVVTTRTNKPSTQKKETHRVVTMAEFESQLQTPRRSALPEANQFRQLLENRGLEDEIPDDTYHGLPDALRFPTRRTVDNDILEHFFEQQHFSKLMTYVMGLIRDQAKDPSCYSQDYLDVHVVDNTSESGELPKFVMPVSAQIKKDLKSCTSDIMILPVRTSLGRTESDIRNTHDTMMIFDKHNYTVQWLDPFGYQAGSQRGARWAMGLRDPENRESLPEDLQELIELHETESEDEAIIAFVVLKYFAQKNILPHFGKEWRIEYDAACPIQLIHAIENTSISINIDDFVNGGGICTLFAAMSALLAVRVRGNIVHAQRSLVKWIKASNSNSLFLSLAFVKNVLEAMPENVYLWAGAPSPAA